EAKPRSEEEEEEVDVLGRNGWRVARKELKKSLDDATRFQLGAKRALAGQDRARVDLAEKQLLEKPYEGGSLLFKRPSYTGDDRLFYDLLAYAPGLNTSSADIQAVLEAEAAPDSRAKSGHIDAGARKLIDKAWTSGWQALTIPGEAGRVGYTILF